MRAVKIIKKDQISDYELKRLVHEIEILKRLDYPNILKLYELFEDKSRYFLVMELCSGGDLLDELTRRQTFNETDTAHIIQQVLWGISYCNRQSIVHRDLKPENILIESKRPLDVKIVDFTSAEIFCCANRGAHKKIKMIHAVGTAYYVAPEVLMGHYNEKCDMWSIGVIMYTMLGGMTPFQGEDEIEIINEVKTGIYDLSIPELQHVSKQAKHLIYNMLKYDPD